MTTALLTRGYVGVTNTTNPLNTRGYIDSVATASTDYCPTPITVFSRSGVIKSQSTTGAIKVFTRTSSIRSRGESSTIKTFTTSAILKKKRC